MLSYLEELTIRTATAVAELPKDVRERHANYLLAHQRADGGFAGREGESDPYYTGFGLRGLFILGRLYGPPAESAARFTRACWDDRSSIVDFLSLIYSAVMLKTSAGIDALADLQSDWEDEVAEFLETLRREDGGYAKATSGRASSTYHTFLVLLCLQMIDRPIRSPESIIDFLLSQQDPEGGFREIRVSKRASTNPTAAAIGSLRMLDALESDVRHSTTDFLLDMQTEEGGFRANTRIPIADLLSTFTALLTLIDVGGFEQIERDAAERYVAAMERPGGGFLGAAWDQTTDVEYTFYGLGARAVLNK